MKLISKTLQLSLLFILITANTSCQEQYPELEDGLYAEFVTNKGIMVAKLYYDQTPVTVANFVALAEGNHPMVSEEFKGKNYYDSTTFHRVMDKFMIQGGDHTATGSGNAGYKFDNEVLPNLRHDKPGILSMANSGGTATNGSQFFITEVPYPSLDAFDSNGNLKNCSAPRVSCHAVFGELVMGISIQDTISNVKVGGRNKPVEDVTIEKLNIIRKGSEAKAFNAPKVFEEELPLIAEKEKARKEKAEKEAEAKAEIAREAFIKKNENLNGTIKKLPTGVVMIFTHESNGVKPSSADKALIYYAGYFENGDLFDTNMKAVAEKYGKYDKRRDEQKGYEPFPSIYNETASLAAGFREAMLNMNVGDKCRVFVPSYLGYGAQDYGPIPANSNLVFDLEIAGIQGKD